MDEVVVRNLGFVLSKRMYGLVPVSIFLDSQVLVQDDHGSSKEWL